MAKAAATDKKTLDLIALVKTKKEQIAQAEKPAYKTNCSFSFIEGNRSNATNLHTETDVRKLIGMAAHLLLLNDGYFAAANALEVENPPPFTWDGFTAAEWIGDIKMRITKVQIAAEKKKLEALEERLNKIISPELRAQLELEAIASELG